MLPYILCRSLVLNLNFNVERYWGKSLKLATNLEHLLYHKLDSWCFFYYFVTPTSPHLSFFPCAHTQSSVLTGQDKTSAASHQAQKGPAACSFASSWLTSQRGAHLSIPVAIDDTLVTSCLAPPPSHRSLPLTHVSRVCVPTCDSLVSRTCVRTQKKSQRQAHTHAHIPKKIN